MQTAAINNTNVVEFPKATKKETMGKLPQMPYDEFKKSTGADNCMQYYKVGSMIDERRIANSLAKQIEKLEKDIEALDVNDPDYFKKYDELTARLQATRQEYAQFNDDNREFGLQSFKERLDALSKFFKDIGKETLEFLVGIFTKGAV